MIPYVSIYRGWLLGAAYWCLLVVSLCGVGTKAIIVASSVGLYFFLVGLLDLCTPYFWVFIVSSIFVMVIRCANLYGLNVFVVLVSF